jgi:hypothetical protein
LIELKEIHDKFFAGLISILFATLNAHNEKYSSDPGSRLFGDCLSTGDDEGKE